MAKGKTQKEAQQSQKRSGGQQRQMKEKPSRGCGSCIFGLIRKLFVVLSISSFVYVATFTGYTYHVKQRMPTVDEFKDFSLEMYDYASVRGAEYYEVASEKAKVYYAHFEKEHLPVIKEYTMLYVMQPIRTYVPEQYRALAVEKAGQLKDLTVKYFGIARKHFEQYYALAAKKIAEYRSGKEGGSSGGGEFKKPNPTTPKPAQAPKTAPPTAAPKTASPTAAPKAATPTAAPAAQKAPSAKPAAKPTEAPKKADKNSKEKKEL